MPRPATGAEASQFRQRFGVAVNSSGSRAARVCNGNTIIRCVERQRDAQGCENAVGGRLHPRLLVHTAEEPDLTSQATSQLTLSRIDELAALLAKEKGPMSSTPRLGQPLWKRKPLAYALPSAASGPRISPEDISQDAFCQALCCKD